VLPGLVAVVIAVVVALALFGRRGGKSIAGQLAAFPGNSRPERELSSARVLPEQTGELSAIAGEGQHALWLQYAITTDRSRSWSGQVILVIEAPGGPKEHRFPIEYDGEDHRTGPDAHGLVYFPAAGADPPATNRGTLKLASLTGVSPGQPIRLRVSIHPTGAWVASELRVFIGASPT